MKCGNIKGNFNAALRVHHFYNCSCFIACRLKKIAQLLETLLGSSELTTEMSVSVSCHFKQSLFLHWVILPSSTTVKSNYCHAWAKILPQFIEKWLLMNEHYIGNNGTLALEMWIRDATI